MWDNLFNLLALVFWFRIWTREDRTTFFNPYLGPMSRLSRRIVTFLEPVFFGLDQRIVSAIAVVVTIVFRGLLAPGKSAWPLVMGIERLVDASTVASSIAFSALSFGIFLFKLWGISLIYTGVRAHQSPQHTVQALSFVSRPFSFLRIELRPLALLAVGTLLVALLDRTGLLPIQPTTLGVAVPIGWATSPAPAIALKLIILALAGWIQVLLVIQQLLFLAIIGSIIGMVTGAAGLMAMCRDWINLIVGPLRKYPIRIGMFDLTPLVFFVLIQFVYGILMGILVSSLNALP